MKEIFVHATNIHSPLGLSTEENFSRIEKGESGVQLHARKNIHDGEIWASLFSDFQKSTIIKSAGADERYSFFELMMISSVKEALTHAEINAKAENTLFVFSTTKGSISVLENGNIEAPDPDQLGLFGSAKRVTDYFNNRNEPVVISNACISGLAAVIFAERMLSTGQFENAIIVGADTIGSFVFSGFHSFQALSPARCKPFSSDRDGINLGEAAATMILSDKIPKKHNNSVIKVGQGSMSNDANHISGPSRTGEELGLAINKSLIANHLSKSDIGFISAHGTATPYNDEMEAKAIHFAGLEKVPLNSMKGYFGHTLGAAGLLESIISIESMKKGLILPTFGFSKDNLEPAVNVCKKITKIDYNHCLKMASGFGGCNATIIYSKN